MKKKLIVNAVSCSMASSLSVINFIPSTVSADESGPTVYGRFRVGLQRTDSDSENDKIIGFEGASSRFGIKGEEDLGNSLSAIYLYEWSTQAVGDDGASTGLGKRKSYVGIKNNNSGLTVGRRTNSFYALTGTHYALGEEYTGNYAIFEVPGISDKTSDLLSYRYTHDDLELGAELSLDQDDIAGKDIDQWNVAARYKFGRGHLSAGYINSETSSSSDEGSIDKNESDATTVFIDLDIGETGNLYLGAMFATQELNGVDGEDVDSYHVGYSGSKGKIGYFISFDQLDFQDSDDADFWTLAFAYHISTRTRIYIETEFKDSDADNSDRNRQIIGLRHDF